MRFDRRNRLRHSLRNASRVVMRFRNGWLFRQRLLEKIVSAELGFTKSFTVENHSDARSLIGKWNQPEPTINGTNQNCQRAVNSFRTPHTIVVREDRQLLKMIIGLLDLELPSEHRGPSAGIDEVTRWIELAEPLDRTDRSTPCLRTRLLQPGSARALPRRIRPHDPAAPCRNHCVSPDKRDRFANDSRP
jgi:hypothetical protein